VRRSFGELRRQLRDGCALPADAAAASGADPGVVSELTEYLCELRPAHLLTLLIPDVAEPIGVWERHFPEALRCTRASSRFS